MKGKFIPEIPGENVSYPGKKIPRPGPTRNKIPRPDPTRPDPKIFFKMFPDPGPVSVRSGPVRGNSGFRVAPQVFTWDYLISSSATEVRFNFKHVDEFGAGARLFFDEQVTHRENMKKNKDWRIKRTKNKENQGRVLTLPTCLRWILKL